MTDKEKESESLETYFEKMLERRRDLLKTELKDKYLSDWARGSKMEKLDFVENMLSALFD